MYESGKGPRYRYDFKKEWTAFFTKVMSSWKGQEDTEKSHHFICLTLFLLDLFARDYQTDSIVKSFELYVESSVMLGTPFNEPLFPESLEKVPKFYFS